MSAFTDGLAELRRYPSAVAGLLIVAGLIALAVRDQLYGHPLPDRPDEIQRVLDRLDRLERTRPAPEKGLGLM